MSRHLAKCLAENAAGKSSLVSAKPARRFHIVVEGGPLYWLHVEMPASATLADLDGYLRDIWLECCGHLSAFRINGVSYAVQPDDSDWGEEERNMNISVGKVLRTGMKFSYEYDFGSTTALQLKVVGERSVPATSKERVRLLARNDSPAIPCGACGAPATRINSSEPWESTAWLCDTCATKSEEDADYFLPVANSPRAGVCGYTG
jgi:hypothetical protein